MLVKKLKNIANNNKTVVANFSYISLLQVFILVSPLITYPYLIGVLGMELYGYVVTAQVVVSFASLIIDFGTNRVCAKHVAINNSNNINLGTVLSNVLLLRLILFVLCFPVYFTIVQLVPQFREYSLLFLLSYGMTLNELLFPQFFFQGIERMKYITIISVLIKLIFLFLIFVLVKAPSDYIYIPFLYTLGALLAGIISFYVIYFNIGVKIVKPSLKFMKVYVDDCAPIFTTDIIATIKDKLSYMFIGATVGMSDVTIYDLGVKLNNIISQPISIISTVLLPKFARYRNIEKIKLSIWFTFSLILGIVLIANFFLKDISLFFLHREIDLGPIRLLLLAPVILSVSASICFNLFIALGYNKYVLNSMIITTVSYVILLFGMWYVGQLNTIYGYIIVALIAYFVELVYRLFVARKISNKELHRVK